MKKHHQTADQIHQRRSAGKKPTFLLQTQKHLRIQIWTLIKSGPLSDGFSRSRMQHRCEPDGRTLCIVIDSSGSLSAVVDPLTFPF